MEGVTGWTQNSRNLSLKKNRKNTARRKKARGTDLWFEKLSLYWGEANCESIIPRVGREILGARAMYRQS